jgi:hypothetical protein
MRLFPRKSPDQPASPAGNESGRDGDDAVRDADETGRGGEDGTQQLEPVAPAMKRRQRGAERRRLRRYRRYREALTLELGVLAFEMHRSGRDDDELLADKVAELDALDREAKSIARALGVPEQPVEVVVPGIAGACRRCGALLSTEAGYCSDCGAPADEERPPAPSADEPPPAPSPPGRESRD